MSYSHGQCQYDTMPMVTQQQYSPSNGPPFTPKPNGLSPTLLAAQQRASRRRVVQTTCLIATCILITLVGMTFALLSFLCIFHQCYFSSLSIISTAPLGRVLTISQVTSHVVPFSVPIIMGLFSYLLSASWLRSSIKGDANRPTPMQLGLLMSICNGAGLSALFSSIKYSFKRPGTGRKASRPPILRQSMVFLGILLAVTYITAAADAWLHASSTSIILLSKSPYNSPVIPEFGREINATRCQIAGQDNSSIPGQIWAASCGLLNPGSGGSGATLGEGIRVVSNASTLHRVVFADDQTAIVVPESPPSNVTYSAQTLGVKSKCMTITQQCIQPTMSNGMVDYGPNVALNLNCSKAGINYANGTNYSPLCALDSQGMCTFGISIPSNPFSTGQVMTSMAYLSPDIYADAFIPNTGWFVHGNNGAWNVVFCNVTALDVTYIYESSRYILHSSSPKSLTTTRYIMSAGFQLLGTTVVSVAIDGAGLQSDTTYEEAYSLELSRQMLARAAFIYEPSNVLQIQSENNVNGSILQIIPLAIFLGALLAFACQVLYVTLRTVIATWGVQYVDLAAHHLNDPLATMQRLYGHPDPVLTWETDSDKRFGSEAERGRLSVGPVLLSTNGTGGSVFMVTKN